MFDSIAIHRRLNSNLKQPFSVGHLAECLLFYGEVNAVISPTELEELIRQCGADTLINLLSTEWLNLYLNLRAFGSTQTPKTTRINYAVYTLKDSSLAKITFDTVSKVYKSGYLCQQYTKRLVPLLGEYEYDFDLLDGFLINKRFTSKAFIEVVKQTFPKYPIPLELTFQLHKAKKTNAPEELGTDYTFETETNFDLEDFRQALDKYGIEGHNDFLTSFMMVAAAAIQDIDVASEFNSELASEETSAPIIQNAILSLDQYKSSNEESITLFNEHIISNCPSVSDDINSGQRSFDDFMRLLDRSQQFREWLRKAPDDSDTTTIINEYIRANDVDTFTSGMFYKALKLIIVSSPMEFSSINLPGQPAIINNGINLVAGTLADNFTDLVANRFNRWKPNQFVQQDLKPFLTYSD